ncbi:MAG TPA: TetR/AcrR family transcriptional regulator [Kineosporiaceae bacterium]|nr:TetR/AcrR family transcriptional regulator [Kineosporiaceae bacterium]
MARAYRSALRGQQADRTRRRILQVAGEKFARDGYAATSVRQLAIEAGVSVNTLYAIGGKPEIFLAALVEVMDDNPEGARLIDRADVTGVLETGLPALEQVLMVLAEVITAANARAAKLWVAFEEAANTDADLAAAYQQETAKMRADGHRQVERLVSAGLCSAPADPARTVDLMWIAGHPRNYDLLVRWAEWTPADFQQWLATYWGNLLNP